MKRSQGIYPIFARLEVVKVISFKILYWKLLRNDSEAFLFASGKTFWTVSLSMLKSETNFLKPLDASAFDCIRAL